MGNFPRLAFVCMLLLPALATAATAVNPPDLLAITEFELSDGGGNGDTFPDCVGTGGLGDKDGIFFYGDWMYINLQIKNVSGKPLCADISAELIDAATHASEGGPPPGLQPERFTILEMKQEYFETGEERGFPENNGIPRPCIRVLNPAAVSAGDNEIKIREGTYRLRVFIDEIREAEHTGGCTGASAARVEQDPQTWNNEATTYFTIADAHNPLDAPEIPAPFVLFIIAAVLVITRGKGKMKG
ncbi:MAG: hypothetical protein V1676_03255 [Candidatus Diapherotrites archaeon]